VTRKREKPQGSEKREPSAAEKDLAQKPAETVPDRVTTAQQTGSSAGEKLPCVAGTEAHVPEVTTGLQPEQQEVQKEEELTPVPAESFEQLKAEKEEYYDRLLRLKAEFENYKKRAQRDLETFRKYAAENVILEILPVMDNVARALDTLPEDINRGVRQGVEVIHKQLHDALKKVGLTPMETVGQKFDPHLHEAVMHVPSDDHDEGTVIQEFEKGYALFDKVVRHAKVAVSAGKGEKDVPNDQGGGAEE
jgi:molecular chaperone GrpE